MLDLAVDHIRGLQGELQVCTAHVRDPLVHTVRKRTCQSSCYFNSQIATAKQTRSGVEYLDFSIAVGPSSPIITISLCQSILFNQCHHELYRIDQYANRATLIFSPYIYMHAGSQGRQGEVYLPRRSSTREITHAKMGSWAIDPTRHCTLLDSMKRCLLACISHHKKAAELHPSSKEGPTTLIVSGSGARSFAFIRSSV